MQCDLIGGWFSLVHPEEFEIPAEIKDIEFVFILTVHKSRAEPCPTADHLPELRLAHHLLEEHKIQNLRYINTGIQHIDRNGNLREFPRIAELINRTLRIIDPVINYFGKVIRQMRIFLMEHLKDLLCMSMIFGKDNCLADLFPVIDLQPLCHHRLQNFPNGIFVKDPGVQRRRANSFRKISIFINEILLVFLFFFI